MLRGSVRIELRDSRTKELIDVVESENLVTDAVTNVLNGVLGFCIGTVNNGISSYDYRNIVNLPDTVVKTLYGGVLIFSKRIESSKEYIIPSGEDIKSCIGHGGQEPRAAGDTAGGSFNLEESVFSDDYTTLVWDFDTSSCNGQIASICLTSARGGTSGLRSGGTSVPHVTFSGARYNTMYTSAYLGDTLFGGYFRHASGDSNSCLRFLTKEELITLRGNTIKKSDITALKKSEFSYNIAERIGYIGGNIPVTSSPYEGHVRYSYAEQLDLDKGFSCDNLYVEGKAKVYEFKSTGASREVEIDCTNMRSAVLEKLTEVEATGSISVYSTTSLGDKLYVIFRGYNSQSREYYWLVCVLGLTGVFELAGPYSDTDFKTASGGTEVELKFFYINGSLYIATVRYSTMLFQVDTETGVIDFTPTLHINRDLYSCYVRRIDPSPYAAAPWVIGYFNDDRNTCYPHTLFCPYLATINNIGGELIKTADKTMKILYTLRQG